MMTDNDLVVALVEQCGWSKPQAELGTRAGFECEYCGRPLLASIEDYDAWQVDHIVPLSKHGEDEPWNLALSCKICNFMKRNWLPPEGLDPKSSRAASIAAVRALISEKRAATQRELDSVAALVKQLGA